MADCCAALAASANFKDRREVPTDCVLSLSWSALENEADRQLDDEDEADGAAPSELAVVDFVARIAADRKALNASSSKMDAAPKTNIRQHHKK